MDTTRELSQNGESSKKWTRYLSESAEVLKEAHRIIKEASTIFRDNSRDSKTANASTSSIEAKSVSKKNIRGNASVMSLRNSYFEPNQKTRRLKQVISTPKDNPGDC